MKALSFIILALSIAPIVEAQRYEVSGFFGYGSGGGIKIADTQLTDDEFVDIDMARHGSYGLALTIDDKLLDKYELEFLVLRHATQFEEIPEIFSEEPAGDFPPGEFTSLDVDRTVLMGSIVWRTRDLTAQQRREGAIEPYFTAGFGVSHYSEHTPLPSIWAPTLAGGVGIRYYVSERLSFRLDGRLFASTPAGGREERIERDIRDCPDPCYRTYAWPDLIMQSDVSFGLSWKFDKLPSL